MAGLDNFFSKDFTYAVVGASNNESKYGNKIFRTLIGKNYAVIPINPNEEDILGVRAYRSILDVEEKIDVVNFVVPPKVSLQVLEEVVKKGIKKVWFQPGSYDTKVLNYCRKNKLKVLSDVCLLEKSLEAN